MNNKEQIMIDGVDVSGCRYFCRYDDLCRNDNIGRVTRPLCKRIPDCYFKQLALKTQECVKLNCEIIDMNSIIEDAAINLGNKDFTLYDLPFEIKKLTQECEGKERIIEKQRKEIRKHRCKLKELKNKLRTLDEETTTVEITEAEFAEYQSYKKQHQELIEVNNKRKEEIKTLKYMLYEERELCTETFKANFKIAKLERTINSNKSRFTYELTRYRKALEEIEEIIKEYDCVNCSEQHCEDCNKGEIFYIINKAKEEE